MSLLLSLRILCTFEALERVVGVLDGVEGGGEGRQEGGPDSGQQQVDAVELLDLWLLARVVVAGHRVEVYSAGHQLLLTSLKVLLLA